MHALQVWVVLHTVHAARQNNAEAHQLKERGCMDYIKSVPYTMFGAAVLWCKYTWYRYVSIPDVTWTIML